VAAGDQGGAAGTHRELSMRRYLAVFGAVPEEPPHCEWLYDGRAPDNCVHIADVWNDPALR
jgi:hypothetical protein